MSKLADKVRKQVGVLIDPETGMSYEAMGMIQSVKEVGKGVVRIDFTTTSPYCPIALKMALDIKKAALDVTGVKGAKVHVHGHIMEEKINELVQESKFPTK